MLWSVPAIYCYTTRFSRPQLETAPTKDEVTSRDRVRGRAENVGVRVKDWR
jgi:hypothetical protein